MVFKIDTNKEYRLNDLSEDGFYIVDEELQSYVPYTATEEEQTKADGLIAEYNEKLATEAYLAERQALLENGLTTEDGKMWFDEKWGTVFMTKALSVQFIGGDTFKWKDINGEIVDVALEDAKTYIAEMIVVFDKIYLGI